MSYRRSLLGLVAIAAIGLGGCSGTSASAVPSITIQREDGNTASFKVENPKNIAGLKVGDRVLITYTQALAVSVK